MSSSRTPAGPQRLLLSCCQRGPNRPLSSRGARQDAAKETTWLKHQPLLGEEGAWRSGDSKEGLPNVRQAPHLAATAPAVPRTVRARRPTCPLSPEQRVTWSVSSVYSGRPQCPDQTPGCISLCRAFFLVLISSRHLSHQTLSEAGGLPDVWAYSSQLKALAKKEMPLPAGGQLFPGYQLSDAMTQHPRRGKLQRKRVSLAQFRS